MWASTYRFFLLPASVLLLPVVDSFLMAPLVQPCSFAQSFRTSLHSNLDSTDPWEILGVNRYGSKESDIKKAYKRLVVKFHPDATTTNESSASEKKAASDSFARINAAYEVALETLHEYGSSTPERQPHPHDEHRSGLYNDGYNAAAEPSTEWWRNEEVYGGHAAPGDYGPDVRYESDFNPNVGGGNEPMYERDYMPCDARYNAADESGYAGFQPDGMYDNTYVPNEPMYERDYMPNDARYHAAADSFEELWNELRRGGNIPGGFGRDGRYNERYYDNVPNTNSIRNAYVPRGVHCKVPKVMRDREPATHFWPSQVKEYRSILYPGWYDDAAVDLTPCPYTP